MSQQPLRQQSQFLSVDEVVDPPSSFCFRIGNGWDLTVDQVIRMGASSEDSPDGIKLFTFAFCALPRGQIPRDLSERAAKVAEYYADPQNQLCLKPILSISQRSLCGESWENVKLLCEKFRLLPMGHHFPMPELDDDGETIPLPLDVWERTMSAIGGGLAGLASVDANMQSLCWLNSELLKPRDWFKVLKVIKFQGPVSLDSASTIGSKFFRDVFDRPFLLSPRRLNDVDIEPLLLGIAELVFDSVGTFRNLKEAKKFIADSAVETFEMLASDAKKLSFVFQKDVYVTCGALGSGFWGSAWPASSALCLKRIWSMMFWVQNDRSVDIIDCISGGEYSKLKGSDADSLDCWFLLKDPRVVTQSGVSTGVQFDGFSLVPRGEEEPPVSLNGFLGVKRKRTANPRVEEVVEPTAGPTVSQLFPATPVVASSERLTSSSAAFSFSHDIVDLVDDDNFSFSDVPEPRLQQLQPVGGASSTPAPTPDRFTMSLSDFTRIADPSVVCRGVVPPTSVTYPSVSEHEVLRDVLALVANFDPKVRATPNTWAASFEAALKVSVAVLVKGNLLAFDRPKVWHASDTGRMLTWDTFEAWEVAIFQVVDTCATSLVVRFVCAVGCFANSFDQSVPWPRNEEVFCRQPIGRYLVPQDHLRQWCDRTFGTSSVAELSEWSSASNMLSSRPLTGSVFGASQPQAIPNQFGRNTHSHSAFGTSVASPSSHSFPQLGSYGATQSGGSTSFPSHSLANLSGPSNSSVAFLSDPLNQPMAYIKNEQAHRVVVSTMAIRLFNTPDRLRELTG